MRNYLLILSVLLFLSTKAQNASVFTYENFEQQVLEHTPKNHSNISKKNFGLVNRIFDETKSETKNNYKNFNVGDYFNILEAFILLKENKANMKIAFEKFLNAEGSCEYVIDYENTIRTKSKYNSIRKKFLKRYEKCNNSSSNKNIFDIRKYCKINELDFELVKKINQINVTDLKYRKNKGLNAQQQNLDKKNQKLIDSLYGKYNSYIGKSLVGDKFQTVMWQVIQHSNIDMMSEYLPIIQTATREKEIGIVPLKMLIDRFYGLKYGYQIFGTQTGFGFELVDDNKRREIKLKYGIE